jgi:hypothetical protein
LLTNLGNEYKELQDINEGLSMGLSLDEQADSPYKNKENFSPQKFASEEEEEWKSEASCSPCKSDMSKDEELLFEQKYNLVEQSDFHYLKTKK